MHARISTEPPELPAVPVLMGIKHFVLKSHPCRAPYRPSLRDGPSSPPRSTQAPGGCRAEFGMYPGREASQEMGRAPEGG